MTSLGSVSFTVPARVGLVGHPSDGYGGATISAALGNFAAVVELNPALDLEIRSVGDDQWPEGGARLIRATVRRFCRYCAEKGIEYSPRIEMRFRSTIPREVGLAGSSAIVIATLRALAKASGVQVVNEDLPALALAVETDELGMAAGLQDRVIQTYGGLMFMDFERDHYEALDPALVPELFVAWNPSASGASSAAHAPIRVRYARGEAAVVNAMRTLTTLTFEARASLERGDQDAFAAAMGDGYDVRATIFDLDPRHTSMVHAARSLGISATYTGSGGAIVGVASDSEAVAELARTLGSGGVLCAPAVIADGGAWSPESPRE